ncbi:uncharacterized protein LOC106660974 [Cimex lectularius]|uniref:Uncharacterized protein n=1 Tax=Cimex lectularius TaxID=79782 RepID=A0A8I6R6K0_CIMLE|nr:uncharacterized protein LOC106660974 [Cimex lectularius]
MAALQTLSMFVFALLTFLASAESFFLYSTKKSAQERGPMPPQYFRETTPAQMPWGHPQQFTFDGSGPVTVALPVAVPIQPQLAPMPTTLKGMVHNVQLVPCLCPVSKDLPESVLQQQQGSSPYLVQSNPQPTTTQA